MGIHMVMKKEGNSMERGTFQFMKSVNRSLILNKIRINSPISRADIAKETQLTPPTVSSIVKELIEQDLVYESELGTSKGGRKPTMLLINREASYVIGIDVGPNSIKCVLADFLGEIKEYVTIRLIPPISGNEFIALLKETISNVLSSFALPDKIIGIGVAMHGVVNVATGTSLIAPNLGLKNIPIKEELEKEFNILVKVENDARVMALGESWFGKHGQPLSMLAVNLGSGVGAGFVLEGKLFHGAKDIAGEIGHMTIDINGEVCECGNKGCLQAFVSGPSIAKRAMKTVGSGASTAKEISSMEIYQMAKNGDTHMQRVLEETGEILGIGLTNLIHVINPQLIVLGGGVSNAKEYLLPKINETITERGLTPQAKQTKVVISDLGANATALGAVALILVEIFNPM